MTIPLLTGRGGERRSSGGASRNGVWIVLQLAYRRRFFTSPVGEGKCKRFERRENTASYAGEGAWRPDPGSLDLHPHQQPGIQRHAGLAVMEDGAHPSRADVVVAALAHQHVDG